MVLEGVLGSEKGLLMVEGRFVEVDGEEMVETSSGFGSGLWVLFADEEAVI